MKLGLAVVVAMALIIVLLGGQVLGARSQMAAQQETVESAWSQVDSAMQRRAALVPALLELLTGSQAAPPQVVSALSGARDNLLNARNTQEKIQANQALDSAIGELFQAVEQDSRMRDSEAWGRLHDELAIMENRVAQERGRYNKALTRYNTTIEMFPNNIAATLFGFYRNDSYFRTDLAGHAGASVRF